MELRKAENAPFRDALRDVDRFLARYDNMVRFEINLRTMAQIRGALCIDRCDVVSVLSANPNPNPFQALADKILVDVPVCRPTLRQRDHERMAFIREHGCDIKQVEIALRAIKSRSVGIGQVMKPYRRLFGMMAQTRSVKQVLMDMVA